jgi:uncharacterized membrane protein YedE/YeeE
MSMDGGVEPQYWPGWLSGVVLSLLIVAYFWVTGRLVSSSGRVSVLVDRLRHGRQPECSTRPAEISELAEAMRLASIEAFGAEAVEAVVRQEQESEPVPAKLRPRMLLSWSSHLLFLVGMLLGGRLSRPGAPLSWTLGEGVWAGTISQTLLPVVLLLAGVLVGFGTRMAGGCPIGHGLCGMARGQAGSWAAGLSFFGAGVLVALLVSIS